ncbi:MAG: hypothetical protein KGL39_24950 [Patescibacteria group bacterium]|nr:hypothetical protein [Patescibacteria group bacterium]
MPELAQQSRYVTKWLVFEREPDRERVLRRKTEIWHVANKRGEFLGRVEFRATWRQYVFNATPLGCVLAKSCLDDISWLIAKLAEARVDAATQA